MMLMNWGKKEEPQEKSVVTRLQEGTDKVKAAADFAETAGKGLGGMFSNPDTQKRVTEVVKSFAVLAAVGEMAYQAYKNYNA